MVDGAVSECRERHRATGPREERALERIDHCDASIAEALDRQTEQHRGHDPDQDQPPRRRRRGGDGEERERPHQHRADEHRDRDDLRGHPPREQTDEQHHRDEQTDRHPDDRCRRPAPRCGDRRGERRDDGRQRRDEQSERAGDPTIGRRPREEQARVRPLLKSRLQPGLHVTRVMPTAGRRSATITPLAIDPPDTDEADTMCFAWSRVDQPEHRTRRPHGGAMPAARERQAQARFAGKSGIHRCAPYPRRSRHEPRSAARILSGQVEARMRRSAT